jgi:catechol 2,3-dioxygenase-like lactoylglutathione lyase family enzyme
MKEYSIGGIQQVGIGVKDVYEAWKWYIKMFGMDCRIFEDETEAKLMLPYTGGEPQSRHAILALNLQGGSGFEVWQYKGRAPVLIKEEIRLGDVGILVCKVKVKNIDSAYAFYKKNYASILGEPVSDPAGRKSFFAKDPYGNLFQLIEENHWFINENKESGGSCGVVIGVSDIERSLPVYSDILDYDEVVYDSTGVFPDLACLPGGENEFRRVLLKNSKPLAGYFSTVLGKSAIELISPVGMSGKKTYRDRFWGDPGFIHLCFDIDGMEKLMEYCRESGFPFAVDSRHAAEGISFDMGEASGDFAYIEDPDGTLIEFVETHKISISMQTSFKLNLKRKGYKAPWSGC